METGYKGKIIFYKHLNSPALEDCIFCDTDKDWMINDPDYLILGSCEVDVKFTNDVSKEIEKLEKQKQNKLAEMQKLVDYFNGKIRDLQCLTHAETDE